MDGLWQLVREVGAMIWEVIACMEDDVNTS